MSTAARKVTLQCVDGELFEVEEEVAMEAVILKFVIEDLVDDNCEVQFKIPVPNVTGKILDKVMEYCKKHVTFRNHAKNGWIDVEKLEDWDAKFVKVDASTLIDLILAADYLDIKPLLDLACQTMANMMKGMGIEEIRRTFGIKNDYSLEEEEEVWKENQWAWL